MLALNEVLHRAQDTPADGAPTVRLSSYPQGRIEVWDGSQWGTVCGHWVWDSNVGADIVCRSLGMDYTGGLVYTIGDAGLPALPRVAGCQVCVPADHDHASLLNPGCSGEAAEAGIPNCLANMCSAANEQGAICLTGSATDWGTTTTSVQV